jgi:group I intron endonuclease
MIRSGVYKIENAVSGKIYIGSSVNLRERLRFHRTRLNCGHHDNSHLQRAWMKYGANAFTMTPILYCSRDDVLFYEQCCIDSFHAVECGYNVAPIAGNTVGRAPNPERNAKMAATKRGKRQSLELIASRTAWMKDPEKIAAAGRKISAALKGRPKSPEHIRKVAEAQVGKTISMETRERLRVANLGTKHGSYKKHVEHRANYRRPLSASHVEALRMAWVRRRERSTMPANAAGTALLQLS